MTVGYLYSLLLLPALDSSTCLQVVRGHKHCLQYSSYLLIQTPKLVSNEYSEESSVIPCILQARTGQVSAIGPSSRVRMCACATKRCHRALQGTRPASSKLWLRVQRRAVEQPGLHDWVLRSHRFRGHHS